MFTPTLASTSLQRSSDSDCISQQPLKHLPCSWHPLYLHGKTDCPSQPAVAIALRATSTVLPQLMLQKHLSGRFKFGFRPPSTGRRTDVMGEQRVTLWRRFMDLFDPTVTTRTIVNEGAVFGAFALW